MPKLPPIGVPCAIGIVPNAHKDSPNGGNEHEPDIVGANSKAGQHQFPFCFDSRASATPMPINRRRFIQTGIVIALAGVYPMLYGCGGVDNDGGDGPGSAPPQSPFSLGETFDANWWWKTLRDLTIRALAMVPEIGGVLSLLGSIFIPDRLFPSPDSTALWQQFVDAMNKVVDEKIDAAIFALVRQTLVGLTDGMKLYSSAVGTGDRDHILRVSESLNVTIVQAIPQFSVAGHEIALLPLFVQAANLHLGLLRDLCLKGANLGLPPSVIADYRKQLKDCIAAYGDHVDRTCAKDIERVVRQNPFGPMNRSEPLASVLALQARQQIAMRDIRDCWPYFDPDEYPVNVMVSLDREIFSILMGSYFDGAQPPDTLPAVTPPRGPVREIRVCSGVKIDSIAMRYDVGQGPGGASQLTFGGQGGRCSGWEPVVPRGGIQRVKVCYGYAVDALQLIYADGTASQQFGSCDLVQPTTAEAFYADHIVSSIRGFGTAPGYGNTLSGLVIGFQLADRGRGPVNPKAIQHLRAVLPARLVDAATRP